MGLGERGDTVPCHQRLAMAVALELADPLLIFDTKDAVDPEERFLHYVDAHMKGQLDPLFPHLSVWELRHVVNCDATNEELQWGRDFLMRYRPDLVTMDDPRRRYCMIVPEEIAHGNPEWESMPRTYRQIFSTVGKCGPKAWAARFICKAFGIPTWGCKQPGHAALGRWKPEDGWQTFLGRKFYVSHWEGRNGDDFKYEACARYHQRDLDVYFNKVTLSECMAFVYEEGSLPGDWRYLAPDYMWLSIVLTQRRAWWQKVKRQQFVKYENEDEGDAKPSLITKYLAREDTPESDKEIEVKEDGTVRLPACATSKSERTAFHNSFGG